MGKSASRTWSTRPPEKARTQAQALEKERFDTMRKVLVPGTFDPITLGHLDVIRRAAQLFDEVVVGVAASRNKGKGPLFSLEERVALAREVTSDIGNVSVEGFDVLLVDFAEQIGATAVVKGLRATTDFEYEFQMAMLNYQLAPDLETVFVMSAPDYMYVSSSVAKEVASLGGTISGLVPAAVESALRGKYARG